MKDYVSLNEETIEILRNKKEWLEKIENLSNCKLRIEDQELEVEGEDQLTVIRVKEVLKAISRGFDLQTALYLLDENYYMDVLDLKEWGKSRERRVELKGRVIGRKGSFKRMIEEKTNTKIAVKGKTISIIGKWDNVNLARRAIEMILEGKMHSTVQKFLERNVLE